MTITTPATATDCCRKFAKTDPRGGGYGSKSGLIKRLASFKRGIALRPRFPFIHSTLDFITYFKKNLENTKILDRK